MDKVVALLNGMQRLCSFHEAAQADTTNSDPEISKIESPLNANVWKIQIKEGDTLEANHIVAILEAMKLEISVRAEDSLAGSTVEKLLVRPNDVVKAGDPLVLTRKAGK